MTTFTTEDREKVSQSVNVQVEPLPPLFGTTELDKEDTEQMLREQIRAQQLEIQRLKRKIRELENND